MSTNRPRIYFAKPGQRNLVALEETDYLTEDELQELLAHHPDLLPGDQIAPQSPCRWLLVRRELGVPDREDGGGRWSLDHLFLDQHGVPALVECKRAVDTRSRREVVAQMLDYAANGLAYWSIDRIRQAASETAAKNSSTLDAELEALLGDGEDVDTESYWDQVEVNLRERRVRLVFVADHIPTELRRLVEFLNEEMWRVEVFAVEVRQYGARGTEQVIVPTVLGMTESARETKQRSASLRRERPWTRAEFFEALASNAPVAVEPVRETFEWMEASDATLRFGSGLKRGSVTYRFEYEENMVSAFTLWTDGTMQINFGHIVKRVSSKTLTRFHGDLKAIKGLADMQAEKHPTALIADALTDENDRRKFQEAVGTLENSVDAGRARPQDST